jgi:hypothetical protein
LLSTAGGQLEAILLTNDLPCRTGTGGIQHQRVGARHTSHGLLIHNSRQRNRSEQANNNSHNQHLNQRETRRQGTLPRLRLRPTNGGAGD